MNKLLNWLKLFRLPNLLMLGVVQFVSYIAYFPQLPFWHVTLIACNTIFIAAGGYIINDIYDFELDKLNKKSKIQIHKNTLHKLYYSLIFISLCLSIYIATQTKIEILICFLLPIVCLYFYALFLSKYKLFGNILISLLVAESILIFLFYKDNLLYISTSKLQIILAYALFAFAYNWLREVVKDIEDISGDFAFKRKTLPILFGIQKTKIFLYTILFVAVIFIWLSPLFEQKIGLQVVFTLLNTILAILCIKAKETQDFKQMSLFIKAIMFLGILSPLL